MSDHLVCCRMVALEPISHGDIPEQGAEERNFLQVRTVPWPMPVGEGDVEFVFIPAVSGNSIRGMTRRKFVGRILRVLGYDSRINPLDAEKAYFLLAGGTLQGSRGGVSGKEYAEVLQAMPFLELLGGSYRGIFFPGALQVGWAWPVTKETREFLKAFSPFRRELDHPEPGVQVPPARALAKDKDNEALGHVYRFTRASVAGEGDEQSKLLEDLERLVNECGQSGNEDEGSRRRLREVLGRTDLKGDQLALAIADAVELGKLEGLAAGLGGENGEEGKGKPEDRVRAAWKKIVAAIKGSQALYGTQAIPAGIMLHCRFGLADVSSEPVLWAFHAFVETFQGLGRLGGMAGKGFGRVVVECRFADGRSFAGHSLGAKWWEWLEANAETVKDALGRLDALARRAQELGELRRRVVDAGKLLEGKNPQAPKGKRGGGRRGSA